MEKETKRDRKWLFYAKASECVLAFAIIAIALSAAVPTSHNLMTDLGIAGPVIPLLAMFSNLAVNRRSLEFLQILIVLISCAVMYIIALIGISEAWPAIRLNQTKYRLFQAVNFYIVITMILILFGEILVLVNRRLKGKFITNYRIA